MELTRPLALLSREGAGGRPVSGVSAGASVQSLDASASVRSGSREREDALALLNACYAESEDLGLDSEADSLARRLEWDVRESEDMVFDDDVEDAPVADVESQFPDDEANASSSYCLMLGENYEDYEPWMSYEPAEYSAPDAAASASSAPDAAPSAPSAPELMNQHMM
jgi:hypothetical protein